MMIVYRSRYLTRAEVWFDAETGDTRGVDWLQYRRRSHPVPGAKTRTTCTYLIDLTQTQEQLLANLSKDTAYRARRARERDNIICECCNARRPQTLNQFEEMYNTFAKLKGLPPLDRTRMDSMAAAGVLDLSVARDPDGEALLYHANYRDHRRASGMELPSLYRARTNSQERNLIGRANRYLTWNDILRYKAEGLEAFDFGGWYQGTDPAMLRINDFKRGFGGQVVEEYMCEKILTLRGWLVLHVASLLGRAGWLPGRKRRPAVAAPPDSVPAPISVPAH